MAAPAWPSRVSAPRAAICEGWLSIMRLHGGTFHNSWMRVEYGDDVDQVRTVPLPDGRVLLVTGDDVRFLHLPTE